MKAKAIKMSSHRCCTLVMALFCKMFILKQQRKNKVIWKSLSTQRLHLRIWVPNPHKVRCQTSPYKKKSTIWWSRNPASGRQLWTKKREVCDLARVRQVTMTLMYSSLLNNIGVRGAPQPGSQKSRYSRPFVSRVPPHLWIQSMVDCVVLQWLLWKRIHI